MKDQIKSYQNKREKSKYYLDQLKKVAYSIKDSLISEDLESFGMLLNKDLEIKRKFNPRLVTEFMDFLNKGMNKRGAIGGRVCGAGGGGCMIWLINERDYDDITGFLNKQPGFLIDYQFIEKGLEVNKTE